MPSATVFSKHDIEETVTKIDISDYSNTLRSMVSDEEDTLDSMPTDGQITAGDVVMDQSTCLASGNHDNNMMNEFDDIVDF